MTEFETITFEVVERVGWVHLDRPDVHHAFDHRMEDELSSLWRSLRGDDDVRCIVLTATGDKAFCTGIDRSDIPADEDFDPYTWNDPGQKLGPKSNGLFTPVIAAVNGMACGGAFYFLAESDFIVAADHATFFDPHVTFGMAAVYEPLLMLPRMPYGEIARLALSGSHERMSATRAHQIGLVSEVVPSTALHDAVRRTAEAIASQPARPLRTTVEALWRSRQLGAHAAYQTAPALLHVGNSSASLAEGQKAFESGARIQPRIR